jgi:hypothetical protein
MKVVMKINYSPNSMNLWNRIKKKLGSGKNKKINIDNCKFNLMKKYTEKTLIDDVKDLHNERLNHEDID